MGERGLARFAVHVVGEHGAGAEDGGGDDNKILIMADDMGGVGSVAGVDAAVVVALVGAAWNNVQ
jgi:hypothetical protein